MNYLKSSKLLLGLLFFLGLSFCLPFFVQAGGLVPCGGAGEPACQICHLWQLFSNVINFMIFKLTLPIGVFMIVIAGLMYLISAGEEKKIQLAKNIILNVVIGIVLIMSSWLIVDTLIKTLASQSSESGQVIWAWNEFPDCPGE